MNRTIQNIKTGATKVVPEQIAVILVARPEFRYADVEEVRVESEVQISQRAAQPKRQYRRRDMTAEG